MGISNGVPPSARSFHPFPLFPIVLGAGYQAQGGHTRETTTARPVVRGDFINRRAAVQCASQRDSQPRGEDLRPTRPPVTSHAVDGRESG